MTPEAALRDNKRYAAVWEVLQALRAHDERFNAMVNRIELTSARDDKVNVIGVPAPEGVLGKRRDVQTTIGLTFAALDEWRDAIYAKIVAKVGSRKYWEQWAKDVADIAQRHITRITALLDGGNDKVSSEFDIFLEGLRGNLNDGISRDDAVDMLAQHLITRPVFEALFGGYDFAVSNPVAQTMERMLSVLDEHALDDENASLERFYESVRMRVQGVDTAEGRQKLIVQLYDTFFRTAFAKTVDKLGIVYTPVEIVDFILRSADTVLRQHFGQSLTDEGVHILDGFAGTGTFLVRLLQLGLIGPGDLARKYANELHANEILLLAYYIAAVNIETTYQDLKTGSLRTAGQYEPFPGLILTDTFQSWEENDRLDDSVFPENNKRLEHLKSLPITVIVGNPPYSVGQDSANDENVNEVYPSLDKSIRDSYGARSSALLLRNLYDSYVRAIRWASLRIKDRGVIAFVTNGGWLDSNTFDGMRLTLAEEFSSIYVINLRGNQRTAGEQSRREGGKVFDAGSRATVAITVLVKDGEKPHGNAEIHYTDIGDYLSRDEKLKRVAAAGDICAVDYGVISPNGHGDWLNQRRDDFAAFAPMRGPDAIFDVTTLGVSTSRDAWVYSFSMQAALDSATRLVDEYEETRQSGRTPSQDQSKISWSDGLRKMLHSGRAISLDSGAMSVTAYRPFTREWLYHGHGLVERPGRTLSLSSGPNKFLYVAGMSSAVPFTALMTSSAPNLHLTGAGSGGTVWPRWRYEPVADEAMLPLEDPGDRTIVHGLRRVDNISDDALDTFQASYGQAFTKDDVFAYCYGLLHSPAYRETYAADLKKVLPRIPIVKDPSAYVAAGRRLSELHLGYESVEPYPLGGLDARPPDERADEYFRVTKMAFVKAREPQTGKLVADRSTIIYNSNITLSGIPNEAYRYMIGARSAIEWIMDRYQVRTDKASGIVNDPNDWSREVGDPRYIIDLLARIVTVSLETMKVVDGLPPLDILPNQGKRA